MYYGKYLHAMKSPLLKKLSLLISNLVIALFSDASYNLVAFGTGFDHHFENQLRKGCNSMILNK